MKQSITVTVIALAVAAVSSIGGVEANADVVVIPPTATSSDPDVQRLNSIATLNAFFEAIDEAPVEGRTIQLLPGVYDFSALVILDPVGDPPPNYSEGLSGTIHYFDPYNLVGIPPYEDVGYGIPILGKQHLSIMGAPPVGGTPTSIVRGCTDPACLDVYSPLYYYNIAFSIGGDYEIPSRFVKLTQLAFEGFSYAFLVDSHDPYGLGVSDPRFGEGTEDLLIEGNLFQDVLENFVGRKQLRPTIRGNVFSWTGPVPAFNAHLALLGQPNERHPIDAIIEDNTFEGTGYVAVYLMNQHEGTVVRDNDFTHSMGDYCAGELPVSMLVLGGDHGIHPVIPSTDSVIRDNKIDGGCAGIAVWGMSGWEIRDNSVKNAAYGIWTEWGPYVFDEYGIVQPTVAEDLVVRDNSLRFNSIGVYIGARARNNTYQDNRVKQNTIAGYYLAEPLDLGWIILGPPSGNTIIGAKPGEVVDMSGCYQGPNGCPQIDEDGDGLFSEDPVNNLNDDGDLLFDYYSLNDEDLEETPNIFIGD